MNLWEWLVSVVIVLALIGVGIGFYLLGTVYGAPTCSGRLVRYQLESTLDRTVFLHSRNLSAGMPVAAHEISHSDKIRQCAAVVSIGSGQAVVEYDVDATTIPFKIVLRWLHESSRD
jgi:hypothetical protein